MSGTEKRGRHEPRHWTIYEELPPEFRKMLQRAPTNYQAGWVRAAIRACGPVVALRVVRQRIALLTEADIRRHYGPDHPQLRR